MNYKILFEKFVKSSGLPSYIPNVGSLIKNVLIKTVLMNDFPAVIRDWQDCHIRSSHRRCSVKKLFSEILQNSQENTYARVSFLIKVKKKTLAQVFSCEFCAISKNTFIYRTCQVAASAQIFSHYRVISHIRFIRLIFLSRLKGIIG